MYLNVLMLSDITTAKGDYINSLMFSGDAQPAVTKHRVNQAKPSDKAWKQWRRLLLMLTHNSPRLRLKKPLGRWLVPWSKMRCQWPFLYDPANDCLYHHSLQGYTQHEKLRCDFDRTPAQDVINPEISLRAVPVNVSVYDHTYRLQWGWQQSGAPLGQEDSPIESFVDLLPSMEPWEWQLLFDVELACDEQEMWEALTTQTCTIATDGSAQDGKGSFAWVISDGKGEIMAECKGPVMGENVTSFHAEGYGILSLLRFLISMSKAHGEKEVEATSRNPQEEVPNLGPLHLRVQQHQMKSDSICKLSNEGHSSIKQHYLVCDNLSMVNKTNEISRYITMYPNSTMASEYDVLAEIRTAMHQLGPSQPVIDHIKGHQNEKKPWHKLTHAAQMNCRADALADQYLQEYPGVDRSRVSILPTSGCQLHLAKGTTTYDLKLKLTHARTVPPLQNKLCEKNSWDRHVFGDINWTAHGQALKRLKQHRKTLVQYFNDWLPVGKRIHRYNTKYPECCPSCTAQVEDTNHLMTCPASSRDIWRKECRSTIRKALDENNTAHPIKELMMEGLTAMLHNHPVNTIKVDQAVADVAAAQNAIGWNQILKGRFSKLWASTQNWNLGAHATAKVNGSTWMIKVIETILMQWVKMWKLRNDDKHGRDLESRQHAEARQTIRELEQFYMEHDGKVTDRLQWLFDNALEVRREQNIGTTIQWLNTWKPIVERSYNTALTTG